MEPKAPLAECEECPLRDQRYVLGRGPDKARLVIIGEAPGQQEVASGIPFTGKSGQLLNKVLEYHGINREEVYVTNTVLCRPPKNRTPTAKEIRYCSNRLQSEVNSREPQTVLTLGAVASKAALQSKDKISDIRVGGAKQSEFLGNVPIIATFHPAAALRNPDLFPNIVSDVKKVTQPIKVGWEYTEFEVCDDEHMASNMLMDQVESSDMLCLDVENDPVNINGNMLYDRRNPDLLCVGISHEPKRAVVYSKRVADSPYFKDALIHAFNVPDTDWVMQNGKYDIQYLWGVGVRNARLDEDTMLMHYATDERKGTHDLEQIATEVLGAPYYKTEAKSYKKPSDPMSMLPTEILYKYNAMDADVTFRLGEPLHKQMVEDGTDGVYYELMIPGANALAHIEFEGIRVDLEELARIEEELSGESAELETKLHKWVKNPRSFPQVGEALAELGYNVHSTAKSVIEGIHHEFPELLLEYRSRHKLLSTYVNGIKKRLINGMIHPSFNVHGTESGRLSASDPNIQNVPPSMRTIFTASREDRVLVSADYSAIELRVAAVVLGDPWLLEQFRKGRPIHKEVATRLFGPDYTQQQYTWGKNITFGIFYDERAPAISKILGISVNQAQSMIDDWKANVPMLDKYHERIRREIQDNAHLTSLFGRKRRFWLVTPENALDVYREGYNFEIQSPASDITLRSLIRLEKITRNHLWAQPIITVHDSITADVAKGRVDEYCQLARGIMEDTPDFDVPTPVEFKIGYRWDQQE